MIRRGFFLLVAIACAATAAYVTRATWGPAVARHLDVGTRPEQADYALVLAGDVQTRPRATAALYRHGYVRQVLLTRPPRTDDSPQAGEDGTDLARRLLIHEGVKPDDVRVLDGDVRTTMDEAQVVEPLLKAEPQARLVVVTSDYHTRRGLWAVRHRVPETADRITAFSAPTQGVTPDNWWHSQTSIGTYCGEYARLMFYYVRYGEGALIAAMVMVGVGSLWMLLRVWRRHARAF